MTRDALLRGPYLIVDDFMPPETATSMRNAIEAHLGNPYQHRSKTHMIWDYWHVPGLYTYLRTLPDRVIGSELTAVFQDRLIGWSKDTLGLGRATSPYLSLYVHGCRQNQHNDSANGRFGFVYSLTKNERRTTGGETLIWREDDYFSSKLHRPSAGEGFYHIVAPKFNRLLVFDDRMPHAVQLVEGIMDPIDGRIVLHGHIHEAGPIVNGPLRRELVADIANKMSDEHFDELGLDSMIYHGVAVVRLTVQPDGQVTNCHLLVDRVKQLAGRRTTVQAMLAGLLARASRLCFPTAAESTIVTIPIGFGDRPDRARV